MSDYPALLASDCPTIHMLTVPASAPSPAPVPSTPTARATAEAARRGRQDQLLGRRDTEGSAAQQQRQQAEQCEADRLLAIAMQAEEEENAAAATALLEQYDDQIATECGSRFSDSDEDDTGGDASSAGGEIVPEPSLEPMDEIAGLAEEISTAQAQTAWSGESLHSYPTVVFFFRPMELTWLVSQGVPKRTRWQCPASGTLSWRREFVLLWLQ